MSGRLWQLAKRLPVAPLSPLTDVDGPRETLKTVPVLFADMSGSTALGERLDPEALRVVIERYFDA